MEITNYKIYKIYKDKLLKEVESFGIKSREYIYITRVVEYLEKGRENKIKLEVLKNIYHTIKICNVFKNFNCDDKNIINFGYKEFLKLNNNHKIYCSTDIHGDLTAFLYSLLKSGVAKYNYGSPVLYFDMTEGDLIRGNIEDYPIDLIPNLIPIPNLIINRDCNDKFIYCGDLIDRGQQSDSCFCLMFYLLDQDGAKDKIEYIIGNHEDLTLNLENIYDTPLIYLHAYNALINDRIFLIKDRNNICKNSFKELIEYLVKYDRVKFCTNINDVIFSHTNFEKEYVLKCIKEYKDDVYGSDITNFNILEEIQLKIIDNMKLDNNNIILLVDFINKCFKINCGKSLLNKDEYNIFNDKNRNGLLWSREYSGKTIKGIKQVVGHNILQSAKKGYINSKNTTFKHVKAEKCYNPEINFEPEIIENDTIIRFDVLQSSGFRNNETNATIICFEKDKDIIVENMLIKYKYIDLLYNKSKKALENYELCLEEIKMLFDIGKYANK